MYPYLYGALTRLTSVPTALRARLLGDVPLLLSISRGSRAPNLHPSLSKAVAKLDWARCEREDRAAERAGCTLVSWDDPRFPQLLRALPDPPPAFYIRGSLKVLEHPALAVVGSRLSTVYGQNMARELAADAARAGLAVISGLARGIDAAAHRGSLAVQGRAVGILGTGIDVPYPREHEPLLREIVERGGAILTEFPPGSPPVPRHFPMRNRLIAGLAWGVLVVEATERSGSLITARFAAETGKEVFAVPHNLTNRTGVGPNTLIQKGAKLVQRIEDVLEELPEHESCRLKPATLVQGESNADGPAGYSEVGAKGRQVLRALSPEEALGVDALCDATGLPPSEVLVALLELQMAGACVELPGTRFALNRPRKEPS